MDQDTAFMSNLKGSAAANILTGSFIMIFWILKNKCKHSKCEMNNSCFQCSVKEDDDDIETGREEENLPGETKIRLRRMLTRKHQSVYAKHASAISSD